MPSGDVMLELLKLCPDAESLKNFGIDITNYRGVVSATSVPGRAVSPQTTLKESTSPADNKETVPLERVHVSYPPKLRRSIPKAD